MFGDETSDIANVRAPSATCNANNDEHLGVNPESDSNHPWRTEETGCTFVRHSMQGFVMNDAQRCLMSLGGPEYPAETEFRLSGFGCLRVRCDIPASRTANSPTCSYWSILRSALRIMALGLLVNGCGDEWEPEIREVRVFPPVVQVLAGSSFQLQARLRDPDGNIVNIDGFEPKWEILPGPHNILLEIPEDHTGMTVNVKTAGPTHSSYSSTGVQTFTVKVRAYFETGDITGNWLNYTEPAEILIAESFGRYGVHEVEVLHDPFAPPAIMMVRADRTVSSTLTDLTVGVVGIGWFPAVPTPGTPEIAVFYPNRRMYFGTPVMDAGVIDGPAAFNPSYVPQVKVALWRFDNVDEDDIDPAADLALASSLFLENKVGVEFWYDNSLGVGEVAPDDEWKREVKSVTCDNLPTVCGEPLPEYTDGAINVYYVKSIRGAHGYTCPNTPVIYMAKDAPFGEVLAHELGHALGLRFPWAPLWKGHTGKMSGEFKPNNLMWTPGTDKAPTMRKALSLGQGFRINIAQRSWLNVSPTLNRPKHPEARCCGCNPYCDQPCPPLASDVGLVNVTGTVPTSVCAESDCPTTDCAAPIAVCVTDGG